MKTFRCGDVVPGCAADFEGTEAEILALVAAHAPQHGAQPDEALLETVRRAIRPA